MKKHFKKSIPLLNPENSSKLINKFIILIDGISILSKILLKKSVSLTQLNSINFFLEKFNLIFYIFYLSLFFDQNLFKILTFRAKTIINIYINIS